MTAEEYQVLVQKIQALYKARIEEYAKEMESEQEKDLLAIMRIWRLEHGEEPTPPLRFERFTRPAENGSLPKSQKDKIRVIIKRLSGIIDTVKVLKTYGEVFCDDTHPPDGSTVSKVFREMIDEGKLECTKKAGFQQAAQYKKIGS